MSDGMEQRENDTRELRKLTSWLTNDDAKAAFKVAAEFMQKIGLLKSQTSFHVIGLAAVEIKISLLPSVEAEKEQE